MHIWDYNIYLGNESDSLHIDFVSNGSFFLVAEVHKKIDKDKLKALLEDIKDTILNSGISDLEGFETTLDKKLKELGKSKFSIAAALESEGVLYSITRGSGEIYVSRGGKVQKLISGDKTASGYLQPNDFFVLTNPSFIKQVNTAKLQELLSSTKPQQIVETLTPDLKGDNDTGLIAMFMQYNLAEDEVVEDEVAEDIEAVSPPIQQIQPQPTQQAEQYDQYAAPSQKGSFIKSITSKLGEGSSLGKKVTFLILVIIVGVFIWSVVLGNQRRERNAFIEKIQEQESVISEKLNEADEVAILNSQKALELLNESQSLYQELADEADKKKLTDLEQLQSLKSKIEEKEQDIKKTEEGKFSEYYDLNLIEKGSQASRLYSDGETLALLDDENSKIHLLAIEKKSVDSVSSDKVKDATYVALHQDVPYIYGKDIGVVKLGDEEEEVIEPDDELGTIRGLWMFNGNIYLLDTTNDEVYKYLVAEEGYSNKTSYFQSGQAQDLSDATGLAIDASVYISTGSEVEKYVSGNNESYSVSLPEEESIEFEDIYTDANVNEVYLLDKDSGRIFVMSKEGNFEKQVAASIIQEADDFLVDANEGILVLVKDKIYKVE